MLVQNVLVSLCKRSGSSQELKEGRPVSSSKTKRTKYNTKLSHESIGSESIQIMIAWTRAA